MLRDTNLNPNYTQNRKILQHSTGRALAMGNDITAYGYSMQFMVDTIRETQSQQENKTITYKPEILLDRIEHLTPTKIRLKEYIHNNEMRQTFWQCYKQLRDIGHTRQEIMSVVYAEIINNGTGHFVEHKNGG